MPPPPAIETANSAMRWPARRADPPCPPRPRQPAAMARTARPQATKLRAGAEAMPTPPAAGPSATVSRRPDAASGKGPRSVHRAWETPYPSSATSSARTPPKEASNSGAIRRPPRPHRLLRRAGPKPVRPSPTWGKPPEIRRPAATGPDAPPHSADRGRARAAAARCPRGAAARPGGHERPTVSHGVVVGDVTSRSAVLWAYRWRLQTTGPARIASTAWRPAGATRRLRGDLEG